MMGRRLLIAALLLPIGAPIRATAQWINYPDKGIPRLKTERRTSLLRRHAARTASRT